VELGLGLAEPADRFRIVLRHAATVQIDEPELILGVGISVLGKRLPFLDGGGVVAPSGCLETGLVIADGAAGQAVKH
jgi:hypothetical protein